MRGYLVGECIATLCLKLPLVSYAECALAVWALVGLHGSVVSPGPSLLAL